MRASWAIPTTWVLERENDVRKDVWSSMADAASRQRADLAQWFKAAMGTLDMRMQHWGRGPHVGARGEYGGTHTPEVTMAQAAPMRPV